MSELIPCPFCGAVPWIESQQKSETVTSYALKCDHDRECMFIRQRGVHVDGIMMTAFSAQVLEDTWNHRTNYIPVEQVT